MIGNITIDCELARGEPMTVVGFENHAGRTQLGDGLRPLGRVLHGHGNNGRDGGEGVRAGRIARHLRPRPAAAEEPALADVLIAEALERRNGAVELEPLMFEVFPTTTSDLFEKYQKCI